MIGRTTKMCTKCRETKSVEEFSVNNARPDGWSNWCLVCHHESTKRQTPEQRRQSVYKWRSKPENARKDKLSQKASRRAKSRLAERYAETYADFLDEERVALGLPPAERRRLVG